MRAVVVLLRLTCDVLSAFKTGLAIGHWLGGIVLTHVLRQQSKPSQRGQGGSRIPTAFSSPAR